MIGTVYQVIDDQRTEEGGLNEHFEAWRLGEWEDPIDFPQGWKNTPIMFESFDDFYERGKNKVPLLVTRSLVGKWAVYRIEDFQD